MFWEGLAVGLLAGGTVGLLTFALLHASRDDR